jgi:hypothetical protein
VTNGVNNKSSRYFIACALQRCECCQNLTQVVGLVLPAGHETLEVDADSASEGLANDSWEAADGGAILFDIEYLPDTVRNRLRQLSQHYRTDVSQMTGSPSWLNHCSFCGAQQADIDLYCEPEGAFMPNSAEAAKKIWLHEVRETFAAQAAGYAYAPEFLEHAQQAVMVG